jgi:hypothetical protein
MSKDKGTKNLKKAPASKTSGKVKVLSAYKSEVKPVTLDVFKPKNRLK